MSDLQCAATFLVLPPAADVPLEQLRAERAACLYAEPGVDATVLAQALGVTARDLDLGGGGDLAGVGGALAWSAGHVARPGGAPPRRGPSRRVTWPWEGSAPWPESPATCPGPPATRLGPLAISVGPPTTRPGPPATSRDPPTTSPGPPATSLSRPTRPPRQP